MHLIFFESIQQYVPENYVKWLQETILPVPLSSVMVNPFVPTIEYESGLTSNQDYALVEVKYDINGMLMSDVVDEMVDDVFGESHHITRLATSSTNQFETSIVYLKELKTNSIKSVIVSGVMIAGLVSLVLLHKAICSKAFYEHSPIAQSNAVVNTLLLILDSSGEHTLMELLPKVFGGVWNIFTETEFMHNNMMMAATMIANSSTEGFKEGIPAIFLPKRDLVFTVKNSRAINKLFGLGDPTDAL